MINWIEDGHTVDITVTTTGLVAVVNCPASDQPVNHLSFDQLPECRKGDGVLVDCVVQDAAARYQGGELWHGHDPAYTVRSLPVPVRWCEDGDDQEHEVYLSPHQPGDPAAPAAGSAHRELEPAA